MTWEDCYKRLEELSQLQDGWHDGDGHTIQKEVIDTGRILLSIIEKHGLPKPYIFPNVKDGLFFEFDCNESDFIEIEILQESLAEVFTSHGENGHTKTVTLGDNSDYTYLLACLRRFAK